MLEVNMDLVYWAFCHRYGYAVFPLFADRLAQMVFHTGAHEVAIIVWDFETGTAMDPNYLLETAVSAVIGLFFPGLSTFSGAVAPANIIHIARGSGHWQNVTAMWNNGSSSDRCSAALILSAIILHELCHEVWANTITDTIPGNRGGGDRCYGTEIIEQTYYWALYKRYWSILSSSNCVQHDTYSDFDCLFGGGMNAFAPGYYNVYCTAIAQGGSDMGFWRTLMEQLWEALLRIWGWLKTAGSAVADFFESLIDKMRRLFDDADSGSSGGCNDLCNYCPDLCVGCRIRSNPPITMEEHLDCIRRSARKMMEDMIPDVLETQGDGREDDLDSGDSGER